MAYFNNGNNYGNGRSDGRIEFRIFERLGILDRKDNGWTKEVNIVSWNGKPGKIDIRDWDPEHLHMSRGITLWEKEAVLLAQALNRRYTLEVPGDDETFDAFYPDQINEQEENNSLSAQLKAFNEDGSDIENINEKEMREPPVQEPSSEEYSEEYNVPDAGPLYGEGDDAA